MCVVCCLFVCQLQVDLLDLLRELIASARHLDRLSDDEVPVEFQSPVDPNVFVGLVSVQRLCFMANQPLIDLKGQQNTELTMNQRQQCQATSSHFLCVPVFIMCVFVAAVFNYIIHCIESDLINMSDTSSSSPAAAADSSAHRTSFSLRSLRQLFLSMQNALHSMLRSETSEEKEEEEKRQLSKLTTQCMHVIAKRCDREWRKRLVSADIRAGEKCGTAIADSLTDDVRFP